MDRRPGDAGFDQIGAVWPTHKGAAGRRSGAVEPVPLGVLLVRGTAEAAGLVGTDARVLVAHGTPLALRADYPVRRACTVAEGSACPC
jgi:hypothetical protein